MRFVFQHGWGFSSCCWDGWLNISDTSPILRHHGGVVPNFPSILGNRGYWGPPALFDTSEIKPGFILVCHSLGVHLVPPPVLLQTAMVVIISGFAHFHGETTIAGRFTKRHIQRMLTRLATEPVQLIHDFYRDCEVPGSPPSCEEMNIALLAADLHLLNENRLEKSYCQQWPPTLLIHGSNDRIVAPKRAEELVALLKAGQLTIIDGAGHGIPFTHPQLCLNLIVDFYHHIAHSGK